MRYIVETTEDGNDRNVWKTINKLEKGGLITVIEKGDPIEEMKANLRKVTRAMQLLNEIGISGDIMEAYIYDKTKVPKTHIRRVLYQQKEFFDNVGVKLK